MYSCVVDNLINRFHYEKEKLYLLIDSTFDEIAQDIQKQHMNTEIISFTSCTKENIKQIFELPLSAVVLLLADPESYVKYQLYQYLDFSHGEPQIENTVSRVLIFPKDSIKRIFGVDIEKDTKTKNMLMTTMRNHQKYRIITQNGTDLLFESREWIPLDFEICTAPIEDSVSGVITVDGALFFKEVDETLVFKIEKGKVASITASSLKGQKLADEYLNMTEGIMKNPVNKQLAEIGIGFCNGAIINDCFMEAETVVNTCHFCFGNNLCYGGNNASDFHGASILIKNPIFEKVQ